MILYIDTTSNSDITLALKQGKTLVAELVVPAMRMQAELLLPSIEKLLKANKQQLSDLTAIEVNNLGGSFTSLRVGVVTANALAFALGIPVTGSAPRSVKRKAGIRIVEPKYTSMPQVTVKKAKLI